MRRECLSKAVSLALRIALGWHLAYYGVWALTSAWTFSWFGRFHCAHWLGSGFFRAVGGSAAIDVIDPILAWGLLIAGILLMLGKLVKPAAIFGIAYLLLMYILNPPHFGHTGEGHYLFIDRNIVEVAMLAFVMLWKEQVGGAEKVETGKAEKEVSK